MPKLFLGSEKIGGCKNDTDVFYLHAKFAGDPPLNGGWDGKVHIIFFIFSVSLPVCLMWFSPFLEEETAFLTVCKVWNYVAKCRHKFH